MLRCSPEAFAKCPTRHICGNIQEATFMEGSECDQFNQSVMDKPMTNGDRIRAMNDYELAVFLAKTKSLVYRDELHVIAYSTQDMADNLEWLQRPSEEVH